VRRALTSVAPCGHEAWRTAGLGREGGDGFEQRAILSYIMATGADAIEHVVNPAAIKGIEHDMQNGDCRNRQKRSSWNHPSQPPSSVSTKTLAEIRVSHLSVSRR